MDASKDVVLPWPLVRFKQHPKLWMRNFIWLLVLGAVMSYIGLLMGAGTYYIIFQNPVVKPVWHFLISDNTTRHYVRNVGEGFYGGLLGQQTNWNHYKPRSHDLNRLDIWEIDHGIANLKDDKRLSVRQLASTPFTTAIYAIPGFLVAYIVIHFLKGSAADLHNVAENVAPQTSIWGNMLSLVTQDWDQKLLGFGSAFFFGRRPANGVFDDMQLWFAESRVASDKPLRWYHPPTFQARCNDVAKTGQLAVEEHGKGMRLAMASAVLMGVALAGYGSYILNFVA